MCCLHLPHSDSTLRVLPAASYCCDGSSERVEEGRYFSHWKEVMSKLMASQESSFLHLHSFFHHNSFYTTVPIDVTLLDYDVLILSTISGAIQSKKSHGVLAWSVVEQRTAVGCDRNDSDWLIWCRSLSRGRIYKTKTFVPFGKERGVRKLQFPKPLGSSNGNGNFCTARNGLKKINHSSRD